MAASELEVFLCVLGGRSLRTWRLQAFPCSVRSKAKAFNRQDRKGNAKIAKKDSNNVIRRQHDTVLADD
jgi:hypothetical protein